MELYQKIIREEIEKYILKEAVNLTQLENFLPTLDNLKNQIAKIEGINNDEINKYLYDLERYIIQIMFGIKRCVSANSLNEGLRDYGFEVPDELGGNFGRNFVNNFYKGSEYVGRKLGRNNASNYGYSKGKVNPNTVPSVKLSESLRKFQGYMDKYQDLEARFNNTIWNKSQAPSNALTQIKDLQQVYNTLTTNAQGNP